MKDMLRDKILDITDGIENAYFLDIDNYNQASLAFIFEDLGFDVKGVAKLENHLVKELKKKNILIRSVTDFSSRVIIANDKAMAKGIKAKVIETKEIFRAISETYQTIGIIGNHGKTTSAAMTSYVLKKTGFNPSYSISAIGEDLDVNGKIDLGSHFVMELNESDFKNKYNLAAAVINGGNDYLKLIDNVDDYGFIVVDKNNKMVSKIKKKVVTFGLEDNATFVARNIELYKDKAIFEIFKDENSIGEFEINIPGLHNVLNAVSCVATCYNLGVDPESCKNALMEFRGTDKNFKIKAEVNKILIAKDNVNHPMEIKSTIDTAKSNERNRIIAVYQPNQDSKNMKDEITKAFADADMVFVTEAHFENNEKSKKESEDIIKEFEKKGIEARYIDYNPLSCRKTIREIQDTLLDGDMLLILGNGDIELISDKLIDFFKYKRYCATNM